MKDILKTGVVDYVMDWANTKSQRQLQQKSAGKKGSKIKGEAKLSDAKDAGTNRSKVDNKYIYLNSVTALVFFAR